MRWMILFVGLAIAEPAFAAEKPAMPAPLDSGRYTAISIPADPKSLWILDTSTGSLSHCEYQAIGAMPQCTPWTPAPDDKAIRWGIDPETKKLIPLNEAARRWLADHPNSN
jgi:hypothetical protein